MVNILYDIKFSKFIEQIEFDRSDEFTLLGGGGTWAYVWRRNG